MHVVVRGEVYKSALASGRPPTIAELSAASALPVADVRSGLRQLADARILVLQPESGEILMAPPFSAVPTPFVVATSRHTSYANCAWDAIGVSVMMREPAVVSSSCGCCGEALTLQVSPDAIPRGVGVMHFAIPAIRWWDDLPFT